MKKTLLALLTLISFGASSQTLFTYGNNAVSKEEFLRAFNKNNTGLADEEAIREYLDLYTRFKLKVQAGYDKRLDTLPAQKEELISFREQIIDSYMSDGASVDGLVREAWERSKKDIRLSQIYVPFEGSDTAAAFSKITEAYKKLNSGADFQAVALAYSSDPMVKINKGDLGYITAFSIPYNFETVAYNTPAGKYSAPFRSAWAYHIFKNVAERPAAGKMKAAQILLAFPPDATDADKSKMKILADSVYKALAAGAAFNDLVLKYSADNMTYQSGGLLPEFGVGKYEPDFEAAAFSLKTDGEISKPVLSSFGYHILRRIGHSPVSTDSADAETMAQIRQNVQADSRMEIAKKTLSEKILSTVGYKKANFNAGLLAAFADSSWHGRKRPQSAGMNDQTILFSFPKQKVTAADYSKYLNVIKDEPALHRGRTMEQLFTQYIESVAAEYYRKNLEEFNRDFYYQLKEFKEGNLLFEVMQREVWDKAAADSVGLKKYWEQHKTKYWWEESADIVLFTCSDSTAAATARNNFQTNGKNWRAIVEQSDGTIQADSGRFELPQIPVSDVSTLKPGLLSKAVTNPSDNITSFLYVVALHKERSPRSFEDARGYLINDYQNFLEDSWISQLQKKYPVKVDQKLLSSAWTK